jgi:hypothetical protein
MGVRPKHVADNLTEIVNKYWNKVELDGNPSTWSNTSNRTQTPKFKISMSYFVEFGTDLLQTVLIPVWLEWCCHYYATFWISDGDVDCMGRCNYSEGVPLQVVLTELNTGDRLFKCLDSCGMSELIITSRALSAVLRRDWLELYIYCT